MWDQNLPAGILMGLRHWELMLWACFLEAFILSKTGGEQGRGSTPEHAAV